MQDLTQIIASVGGALFFAAICGTLLYSLLLSVILPAIQVIFAREGTFASCFKFGEAMKLINRNLGAFLTAWGISIVGAILVGMIASIVTAMIGWIPCIGWIITLVLTFAPGIYLASVYSHLFGQFGRIAASS
jgi:ABC-type enterochelin transport system permease subunit